MCWPGQGAGSEQIYGVHVDGHVDGKQVTERLARIASAKAEWMIAEIVKWLPGLIYAIICVWMIRMILGMWGRIYTIG